jgi:hypothetical protein
MARSFMLLTSGALFSAEITGYAVVCMAMHMRKINQARFWRVFGVLATTFYPLTTRNALRPFSRCA